MAKPLIIPLPDGDEMPIIFENRSAIAIDKPPGWIVSANWQAQQENNIQLFFESAIYHREFWSKSRNLKFLRFIHRLDSITSGVLLLSKSQGAIAPLSKLFEAGKVEKEYLAIVDGAPKRQSWNVEVMMDKDPDDPPKWKVVSKGGKVSYTEFKVLAQNENRSLIQAIPHTGRTHQIRVHLAHSGIPITGDPLYSKLKKKNKLRGKSKAKGSPYFFGLRATRLSYVDPFQKKKVIIKAGKEVFLNSFGFLNHKEM